MGLIIFIFTCLLIFLTILIHAERPFREAMVRSVLILSVFVVFSTETLSLFRCFNLQGLRWFYLLADALLIIAILWRRAILRIRFQQMRTLLFPLISGKAGIIPRVILAGLILFIALLFIQGIIYPPNNYDSMTYHMARIVHWVQSGHVDYYPTSILRQLYQPPFAEYFIGQLCILSKNDHWANFVQLFFLVSSLCVIAGIARELGLPVNQRLLSVLLVITIPEAVLQSSDTQNDVVVSFFIASAVYFCLICYKEGFAVQYVFLAISVSLAILTKATAYIYLAPVLLVFGIAALFRAVKNRQWNIIHHYLILAIGVALINGGFFYRNYTLSGNFLGTTHAEYQTYANEEHTPFALVSNISRNVALHYGVPVFAGLAENSVRMAHAWIGQQPDNPKTTYDFVKKFRIQPYGTHEDYGANIIQVSLAILIFITMLLFPGKFKKEILLYFLLIISMFLLFCFFLKWQPWHSRLHTPLFILVAPVTAYFMASVIPEKAARILTMLIAVYALLVLTFNYLRPLLPVPPYTARVNISDNRFEKYFVGKNSACHDYREISGYLKDKGYINIGLKFGVDDWEYPLFLHAFDSPSNAIHIDVDNISNTIPQPEPDIDCIVSTEKRDKMNYRNRNYFNFTPGNSVLFLYKR